VESAVEGAAIGAWTWSRPCCLRGEPVTKGR
jgi:hypothetical protein